MKILLAVILVLSGALVEAGKSSANEYYNENLGLSFKYSSDFQLIESEDKSKVTISIGDMLGNTLNFGVSIELQKKAANLNGFDGFLNHERERYTAYKNEITEKELFINKKYRAVEISRTMEAIGKNIKYTIIELPNKNEVLTIHMVIDTESKIELLKTRTKKALQQYSDLLSGLTIH